MYTFLGGNVLYGGMRPPNHGESEHDQALPDSERDRLGAAGRVELAEDGCHMKLDGMFRNAEPVRDGFVALTFGQHSQDFNFARRQRLRQSGRAGVRPHAIELAGRQDNESGRGSLNRSRDLRDARAPG